MAGQKAMSSKEFVRDAIARSGCKCTAVVAERPGVLDFAVNAAGHDVVVRLVDQVATSDHSQLATMLAQGDFTRAAIVYTAEDQPHLTGEIEAYPLSRIDELAASLARESAP
ncbi:MAG: hypothetical protein K2X34_07740 [Hyphomonadaceae bacterium]|nr:hypothetical protein [Hyphomonadaceae bacterium]